MPEEMLLNSFLKYVSKDERDLIETALKDELDERVINLFCTRMYHSLIPVSNSVKDQRTAHSCAKHKLITDESQDDEWMFFLERFECRTVPTKEKQKNSYSRTGPQGNGPDSTIRYRQLAETS